MHIAVSTKLATQPLLTENTIWYFINEVDGMPTLSAIGRLAARAHEVELANVKLRQELAEAQDLIDRWRMQSQFPGEKTELKKLERKHGWERRGTKRPYV